jgi:hypothetical protein
MGTLRIVALAKVRYQPRFRPVTGAELVVKAKSLDGAMRKVESWVSERSDAPVVAMSLTQLDGDVTQLRRKA